MDRIKDILSRKKKIAKSTITYLDSKGNAVDKKYANRTIITEYDKDGNVINEIWGKSGEEKIDNER